MSQQPISSVTGAQRWHASATLKSFPFRNRTSLYPRSSQRSPDRAKSLFRRRQLAATSPLPPKMMAQLTTAQQSYARIILNECHRNGSCAMSLDEIAARGGMSRRTAQYAQQRLSDLRWITVEHRPQQGRKDLTNVIRIIDPWWLKWIEFGKTPRAIGCKSLLGSRNSSISLRDLAEAEAKHDASKRVKTPQELDPKLAASLARLGAAMKSKISPHRTD